MKRNKKQKAGHQKKRSRKKRPSAESSSAGVGTLGGMRGGFRGLFGGGQKKSGGGLKVLDVLLWVVAIGVGGYLMATRCTP